MAKSATAIEPTANTAQEIIETTIPYTATVRIEGVCPILFHRWSNEAVEAKAKAPKGSKAKKTDDLETAVYRTDTGTIGIPGNYLTGAIVHAGRFKQDPRSPRKSMADLLKAAVVPLTVLADTGAKVWDYEDRRRVIVQRNAITRARPALREGWQASFELLVNIPEYVPAQTLHALLIDAGRLVGIGDYRPTYGRFHVTAFNIV